MFSAIIILIVYLKPRKLGFKALRIAVLVFELFVLLLLRSRATIVGLILCLMVMVISRNNKQRTKIAITLVGMATIIMLLVSEPFYNFVFNKVLFAGRNSSDLNELTSGRLVLLQRFPSMISNHWFEGIGSVYYESFPLSAILQFGLIGGLILIGISLTPLFHAMRNRKYSDEWALLFYIAIGFTVNGFFEGLTPFGPGIKCYLLWLLFGIMLKATVNDDPWRMNYTQSI